MGNLGSFHSCKLTGKWKGEEIVKGERLKMNDNEDNKLDENAKY